MEKLLIVPFFLYLLDTFLQVSAFPQATTEHFIIHYLEDRQIIAVRIELNTNAQTEHVTSIAGETLYDFNVRKVAYKDLNSSQCFITDIVEESLESDRRRLKNLQNGVVRGFYLPTFIIHEELNNTSNLTQNIGIILAEFCSGNSISLVVKQTHRRKRDASGDKGQFTHHAYGHYGQQSNNYAHYGHETYITGTTDGNGQIRNQKVNHQQVRSETSHVYPRPPYGNGRQDSPRTAESTAQRPVNTNGPQSSKTDSRTSAHFPQTQYQTQQRLPSYQQTHGTGGSIPSIGGTGQFSLQNSHEGGYQLSLPLGLQAGNMYRGGVRSAGQYGVGGIQPHIRTDFHQYPESSIPTDYRSFDQRQPAPSPTVSRTSHPATLQGVSDLDTRKYPSPIQPGTTIPADHTAAGRRVLPSAGTQTSETQIPTGDRRQPGINYESQQRRQLDHGTIPGAQITPSATDYHTLPHTRVYPASGIPGMGLQISGQQPGISIPAIHMPSEIRQRSFSPPGQISTKIPASDISDAHRVTGAPRPSQIHDTYPDSIHRQQFIPRGSVPQQYLQTPDARQPSEHRFNGDIQRRPAPTLLTSGTDTSYPSIVDASKEQAARVSFPGSPSITSIPHTTLPSSRETVRNGVRYPDATRPQRTITDTHPSGGTYPGESRLPIDTQSPSATRMRPGEIPSLPTETGSVSLEATTGRVPTASRPGETIQDSRYNLSIPSAGIGSETSIPYGRRIISRQTGFEASRIYGQDSASSQTQIQTGLEGTAAEASAAGHYGGLGSQTQVQGGYAGNGSFSAQAQSGFTGGVVQSQVQGGKQGGLSGSSAQVERVGSAQSQVQVLQPSGSASSTAQGRFNGGTTQVQAQTSKTGGSAGAQAQSTGLSSTHVQVNIGGNDVSKDENFQGTVSASVHGGQSAGQSQTQLQGGYDSGRTYAATAQGGFDTALDFQSAVPLVGGKPLLTSIGSQESQGAIRDQHQISGAPLSINGNRIGQQTLMPPSLQTDGSRTYYPSSIQEPSRLPSSTLRETYPGYTSEVSDRRVLPTGPGDYPGFRRLDQGLVPGYSQTGEPSFIDQQTHFGIQSPGTQDKIMHVPETQRQTYPSLPTHTLTDATDQHYTQRYPPRYPNIPGYYPQSQPSTTLDSRYMPSFPTIPQQPGLIEQSGVQHRYPTPAHLPDQAHVLTPSSQTLPSYMRPGEVPVLRTPDGSLYTESTQRQLPMPDLTKIQPEQSHFSFPSPQVQTRQPLPPIQTQYSPILPQRPQSPPGLSLPPIQPPHPPISHPGSQIQLPQPSISHPGSQFQPGQTILQPSPGIRPEQAQTSFPRPHISTTTEKIPIAIPSQPTEVKPDRVPGVSEPDKRDCCAALRDLKRRCCGGTSKQDKTSPCCRSNSDDIFDFSSDDDLDEDKAPCKVVKAICYIVYKPVGKARVCKPTATNAC